MHGAWVAQGREGWLRYQGVMPAGLPASHHTNERKMRTTSGHVQKREGEVQLYLRADMRCGNRPPEEGRCSKSSSVFRFRTDSCEFIAANRRTWHQPCQQFLDRPPSVPENAFREVQSTPVDMDEKKEAYIWMTGATNENMKLESLAGCLTS